MQWFGIAAYAASNGDERVGLVVDEKVYDAQEALKASGVPLPLLPTDLGALRSEVDANLRKVESLLNDINRKWPFGKESELKLP